MKLILASTSPRRKAILERENIVYTAVSPTYDESHLRPSSPEIYSMQLAYQKAMSIEKEEEEVILALDTVVAFEDQILGKPEDRKEAEAMLRLLRGETHRVITAYCILGAEKYVDYDIAEVTFEDFSDEQMVKYLDRDRYSDKAGAYGVQDIDEFKIEVKGDVDTVIGMPVDAVVRRLKGEGLVV